MTTKQDITERRKKWADALRSGKYNQGYYALHKKYADGTDGYCCLGVACDIFKDEVGLEVDVIAPPGSEAAEIKRVTYDGNDQYLPEKLAKYLNVVSGVTFNDTIIGSLITSNDSKMNFAAIADIIESDKLQNLVELEDEEMATMMDVVGHTDLTDDDVYETLEELITGGQPFTAYDVTQKLRSKDFWAEHSSVRDLVSGYAKRESLQCQNMEVRPGIWARQYVPSAKAAVTTTPVPTVMKHVGLDGSSVVHPTNRVKLHPTKRGGVGIPARLVRQIGLWYHQYAIVKDNGVVRAVTGTESSNYTVDRGNRIVVTAATLKKLGLNKDSVYARVVGHTLELKSQ